VHHKAELKTLLFFPGNLIDFLPGNSAEYEQFEMVAG